MRDGGRVGVWWHRMGAAEQIRLAACERGNDCRCNRKCRHVRLQLQKPGPSLALTGQATEVPVGQVCPVRGGGQMSGWTLELQAHGLRIDEA